MENPEAPQGRVLQLFATVDLLEKYFDELSQEIRPCWKRRMEFIFSKPSIRQAWQAQLSRAEKIYKPDFVQHVEKIIAQTPLLDSSHHEQIAG